MAGIFWRYESKKTLSVNFDRFYDKILFFIYINTVE